MSERMSDEHEVTEQLITFLRGRSEVTGMRKYGRPLLPFDGRNSLMDALEEATDLSQYLQKRVMENEAIADLLERTAERVDTVTFTSGFGWAAPLYDELRDMAAKLRADCERSVPVEAQTFHDDKKVVEYTWEQREALAARIAIRRSGGRVVTEWKND